MSMLLMAVYLKKYSGMMVRSFGKRTLTSAVSFHSVLVPISFWVVSPSGKVKLRR